MLPMKIPRALSQAEVMMFAIFVPVISWDFQ
jgi:hypothetical protein